MKWMNRKPKLFAVILYYICGGGLMVYFMYLGIATDLHPHAVGEAIEGPVIIFSVAWVALKFFGPSWAFYLDEADEE